MSHHLNQLYSTSQDLWLFYLCFGLEWLFKTFVFSLGSSRFVVRWKLIRTRLMYDRTLPNNKKRTTERQITQVVYAKGSNKGNRRPKQSKKHEKPTQVHHHDYQKWKPKKSTYRFIVHRAIYRQSHFRVWPLSCKHLWCLTFSFFKISHLKFSNP